MASAKTCVVCEKKIEMASFKNGKVCSENCRSALEKSEEVCAEMNHSAEETIPHDFSYPVVSLEPENLSEKTPSLTKVFDVSSLSEVLTDLMDEGIKYSEKIDCKAYVLKDLEEIKKLFDIQDLEKAAWYIRREIDRRNFCEGLGFEE